MFHKARLLALTGKDKEATEHLSHLIERGPALPEAFWLMIQLRGAETTPDSNKIRWKMEDELGKILPLSTWGRLRDARLEEQEATRTNKPLCDGPVWPKIRTLLARH